MAAVAMSDQATDPAAPPALFIRPRAAAATWLSKGGQQVVGSLFAGGAGQAVEAGEDGQVLVPGQVLVQGGELAGHGHPGPDRVPLAVRELRELLKDPKVRTIRLAGVAFDLDRARPWQAATCSTPTAAAVRVNCCDRTLSGSSASNTHIHDKRG
ncbi:hypothetical protein ACFPOI_04040 [Nonomuraea angiospora]|uniref:Uncharacterized protein n=1 Tax=Nonomuraea angiospora TaxID=46172 RepID=A0ABR9MB93_9ACTN|nr:hypothetical protein [Nonomuraea angiospora]MBE1590181.1 hypothetical protein [Nonomuraea angiospora]